MDPSLFTLESTEQCRRLMLHAAVCADTVFSDSVSSLEFCIKKLFINFLLAIDVLGGGETEERVYCRLSLGAYLLSDSK